MAPDNAPRNIDTSLSDRAILVHILEHVEHLTDMLHKYEGLLLNSNGKPDMIGVAQLRRRARRAGS